MGILEGKAVVVTGAGRGLGQAFALHAAASGAAVVVNDVEGDLAGEVAGGIRDAGGRAVASGHSVADPDEARALVELCVAQFGMIDGLVNNAGLNYKAPPWQDDPAQIRALVEVNVLGPLYCGTAAAEVMHAQGSGVIVNIGSGSLIGQRNAAAYSASKGAVASMTYSWAVDLAEHGIRVNALAPMALTRMVWDDPQARQQYGSNPPPDRIAPIVTYLLSDLSAGITGQFIRLTGDKLHVVVQPAIKKPVLHRDQWEVEDIAKAFDGELAAALEPPPSSRWTL
jgi:NAD(P)-dependent dehydrogenase (short-subunit alcohol dehydrogenase family)